MRPIDGVDPRAREEFKRINRELSVIRGLVANERTSVLSSVGGVRTGAPSDRGSAVERFPEMFIQVDVPNNKVTVYVTIPISTDLSTYDWLGIATYTLT